MLEIDVTGVPEYTKWLAEQALAIKAEVLRKFRAWALHIHRDITELTPQWSGNLAANWALDVNSASSTAQDLGDAGVRRPGSTDNPVFGREPYSRGMDPAVQISLARAARAGWASLASAYFIHNPVEYAEEVETDTGPRPIRPINRLPRTEAGKIAMVHHAAFKYSLGSEVLNEL